jgi:valyl-tRNA synthetase
MSKSLGNSPDALGLIDQFGADGVRMGLMLAAPAGNDILYDDSLCEQGRNFCNKIWNAFRLVNGWNVSEEIAQPESSKIAIAWFKEVLAKSVAQLEDQFSKYRISEALMNLYTLFWDEFSAWYLEMIKPAYGSPIDSETYKATLGFFDDLMRLLHPFMPFITEELWQSIQQRNEGESLMTQSILDLNHPYDEQLIARIEAIKEIVGNVRSIRQQKNISPREALALQVIGESQVTGLESVLTKMANLSSIDICETADDTAIMFRIGTTEYAVPMGSLIDKDAEIAKMREELAYHEKFLKSVEAKLNNPNFVSKAPEKIIAIERKKQSDAKEKIAMLTESIEKLSK